GFDPARGTLFLTRRVCHLLFAIGYSPRVSEATGAHGGVAKSKPAISVQMNTMTSAAKIIELRQILTRRFPPQPSAPATFIPTGLSHFDQTLGGGLLRGAITQLVAPLPSSGSTLVLNEIIHALQQRTLLVA